jgi:hypothetical protein
MRLSDPKAADPETLSGFLRTACEEHAFHGPEEFCPYYDAAALIESQQRNIARLTARASFLEGAKLRLAADNPTMGKSIADVFDDIIKKRLSHE